MGKDGLGGASGYAQTIIYKDEALRKLLLEAKNMAEFYGDKDSWLDAEHDRSLITVSDVEYIPKDSQNPNDVHDPDNNVAGKRARAFLVALGAVVK
jgi:hypothetical protein